jgi:hypothetical protein
MAWMILLKKFGPYIAAVLLLVGIWMHGRSVGTAKWHGKYKDSVQEKLICGQEIVRGSSELIALKATIDKQNTAIEEQSAEYQDRVKATQEAAQRVLREQASSYQRLLQEASEASSSLRERVRTIEQAEACHEAWLEVTK